MPCPYEGHGCSQLLGFVRPKWQRRGSAASGSFGDARNLLRLRLVSPELLRDHSYLSLGFVRPQRHLVLVERVVFAERGSGSFGQHRMHWGSNSRMARLRIASARRSYRCVARARSRVAPSKRPTEKISARARRARPTSTCAAAILHAIAKRSRPASGPATDRARAAICCAQTGSRPAGRLKPCRTALREERALPSGVFGLRLLRPLARLASRLAAPVMQSPQSGRCSLFVLTPPSPECKQKSCKSRRSGSSRHPSAHAFSSQTLSWTRTWPVALSEGMHQSRLEGLQS